MKQPPRVDSTGCFLVVVMIEEHSHTNYYEQHNEVLDGRIVLPPQDNPQDKDGNRLGRLAQYLSHRDGCGDVPNGQNLGLYLSGVSNVCQGTVAGDHGPNVGDSQYRIEPVGLEGDWHLLIPTNWRTHKAITATRTPYTLSLPPLATTAFTTHWKPTRNMKK